MQVGILVSCIFMNVNTDKENNSYELHYELTDENCHIMNAEVESASTVTFLKAVNYISNAIGVRLNIETTSLNQGSIVRYFRIVVEEKDEHGLLLYLIMTLMKCSLFEKNTEHFTTIFDSLNNEEKEQLKSVLRKKHITENKLKSIPSDYAVIRHKANFFKKIASDRDIKSVTINLGHNFSFDKNKGDKISNQDFKKYIVELAPEEITINDAIIYIVSPVLIKGQKNKWKGIFEGESITFDLRSNEFKVKSQNGDVDFRSGSNIVCTLKYKKTIDEEGKEHNSDYRVTLVSKHGVDDNYEETLEGKKKRIEDEQPTLFDDIDF